MRENNTSYRMLLCLELRVRVCDAVLASFPCLLAADSRRKADAALPSCIMLREEPSTEATRVLHPSDHVRGSCNDARGSASGGKGKPVPLLLHVTLQLLRL